MEEMHALNKNEIWDVVDLPKRKCCRMQVGAYYEI